MYLTEKEINLEFESIKQSVAETVRHKAALTKAFAGKSRCWFIGCGSSYITAKSAASMMLLSCGIESYAVAAGDMLLHFERYEATLQGSIVVFLSRSGSTSEVIKTAQLIRAQTNADCLSICAKEASQLDEYCSLTVHIPWAFDRSVCQTKTVGSIYASLVALSAIIGGNEGLIEQLLQLPEQESSYKAQIMTAVDRLAGLPWMHVVVLADAETAGIMEEGALAYKEICQINSNFYNVLDVRHGPMVMINEQTFVFVMLEEATKTALDLVADIKAKGAVCVVCGADDYAVSVDAVIKTPARETALSGIYALYFLQWVALRKAEAIGINPDQPDGLRPWIEIA